MGQNAYVFECVSIQKFIFETGKLRDACGASEIVAKIAFDGNEETADDITSLAHTTMQDTGLTADIHRCAGGVLILTTEDNDALVQFRALYRLRLAQDAPGLNFADAIGRGDTPDQAIKEAYKKRQAAPPKQPDTPPITPLIRPAPLSGGAPAVHAAWAKSGRCKITKEPADLSTLAKRNANDKNILPRKFAGENYAKWQWPITMEPEDIKESGETIFPFHPGKPRRIALVHCDGNGIGQMFANLPSAVDRRAFSHDLAQVTEAAAQKAMHAILPAPGKPAPGNRAPDNRAPARPILLGGDDLSIIVRADLAFDFVRIFVAEFEERSKAMLAQHKLSEPATLTVKTGVVFLGARQPFKHGYELCEQLADCARAPDESRFSFWNLTTSSFPDGPDDLTAQTTGQDTKFWKESWSSAEWEALKALALLMQNETVGRGALRQIPNEALQPGADNQHISALYRRALHIIHERDPDVHQRLIRALQPFGLSKDDWSADGYCPLLDAHVVSDLIADQEGCDENND